MPLGVVAVTELLRECLRDLQAGAGQRLAELPPITVPSITLEGDTNGAPHPDPSAYAKRFSGKYVHRDLTGGIGHNLPQEAPVAFARAVVDADGFARS